MSFLRKHRFKFVIGFLLIVLVVVSFYMLWVHLPYATNQNRMHNIRNQILTENNFEYDAYFNEYVGKDTYYILKIKEDNKSQYAVFDDEKKYIKSYTGEIASEKEVLEAFRKKYEVNPESIEIAYENEIFVYCVKYMEKGTLIYAFYGLDSGEFIKAYQL